MQRSLHLFENAIKCKATYEIYMLGLERFRKYYKIRDFDSLLQFPDKELQIMIEDYVFYLKKVVRANSVRTLYTGIELFFVLNDRTINWKKIRKFFPRMEKRTGKDAWTTDHIKRMLRVEKGTRNRSIVHFLASTGCRIGALSDLQIKYVSEMPDGCKAVLIYPDSIDEYYSFLTPEASTALDEYLEERKLNGELVNEDSILFRQKYTIGIAKPKKMTMGALKSIVPKLLKASKIQREEIRGRHNIQINHGFRKRFNTILKQNIEIPFAITEKLMGHRSDLDAHYLAVTKQELFEGFRKSITDLTIDQSERLKIKVQKQEKELNKIDELERNLNNTMAELERVKAIHGHEEYRKKG